MSDILDWIFFVLRRQELTGQRFFYQSLPPSFEVDLSSVHPYFGPMTMPSLIQEFYEEIAPEETLEFDVVVQMPPRKRYTIELQVKSIRKAEAKIVEPEWI